MKPSLPSLRYSGLAVWTKLIKPWRSIVLLCIISLPPYCFGTAILVLLRGDKVWIAADSMQTLDNGQHRYACKIIDEGHFYWGAATPLYEDPGTGFAVVKLVDKLKNTEGTLRDVMVAFIDSSKNPVAQELVSFRKNHPREFANFLPPHGKSNLIKVVFARAEKGKSPTVVWTTLIAEEASGQIIVSGNPEEPPDNGALGMGTSSVALRYLSDHSSAIDTDPVPVLHASMIAEERADPTHVGGKISILRLDSNGAEWIDKGECSQP